MSDQDISDAAATDAILHVYRQDAAFAIHMYVEALAWGDQRGARNWKKEVDKCQRFERQRLEELQAATQRSRETTLPNDDTGLDTARKEGGDA